MIVVSSRLKNNTAEKLSLVITPTLSTQKLYHSSLFSFTYPSNWKIKIVSNVPKRQIVLVGPYVDKGTKIPGVYIDAIVSESNVPSTSSQDALVKTFKFIPYASRDTGKFTQIYSGGFPYTIVEGKMVTNPEQERVTFLRDKGVSYQLDLSYAGSKTDQFYEEVFKYTPNFHYSLIILPPHSTAVNPLLSGRLSGRGKVLVLSNPGRLTGLKANNI